MERYVLVIGALEVEEAGVEDIAEVVSIPSSQIVVVFVSVTSEETTIVFIDSSEVVTLELLHELLARLHLVFQILF